jgi:thiol-disulfide isomerase/thioredoxin
MNRPLALILAACLLAGCNRQDAAQPPVASPTTTKPAATPAKTTPANATPASEAPASPDRPVLQVKTIDGVQYDLAAHRGKWVVVNFWATWCGPCLKEMPELSALDAMREYIEVVGLAYEDIAPAEMSAFLKAHPVVYPIAIVDVYDPPADFATPRGLPVTYLIGPDGKVAKQFLGPVTAHDVDAAIAAAGGPKAG